MQNTQIKKKRGLRPLDYVSVLVGAALICTVTGLFTASLIALPIQLIHKLTYGPK